MPDPSRHFEQVRHNLEVLELLACAASARTPPADVSDWKCTLLYYIAVHYVRAQATMRNREFVTHLDVRDWINDPDSGFVTVARAYRKLEEASRNARYCGARFNARDLGNQCGWLIQVRDCALALLSAVGIKTPPSVDPRKAALEGARN